MSVVIDYGPHKGRPVEIVKRNGKSARVRLPDGALLWVRTAGLVRENMPHQAALGWVGAGR